MAGTLGTSLVDSKLYVNKLLSKTINIQHRQHREPPWPHPSAPPRNSTQTTARYCNTQQTLRLHNKPWRNEKPSKNAMPTPKCPTRSNEPPTVRDLRPPTPPAKSNRCGTSSPPKRSDGWAIGSLRNRNRRRRNGRPR